MPQSIETGFEPNSTNSAGIENVRTSSAFDDQTRFGGVAEKTDIPKEKAPNRLDSEEMQKRHRQLKTWLDQELQRQGANRYQMALDEDYYDSLQWDEYDAQVLMERGQAPLVFNEIKPTIDWVIGTERRMRIDHKVLPRRKEGNEDAQVKSELLKYLSDTNKTVFHRSRAFDDAIKAGIGWLETGIRGDETQEMLYTRYEDWRKVIYDSNGSELDTSDWRYVFRWKWLDEDIASAYFPERSHLLNQPGTMDKQPLQEQDDLWYLGSRVTQPGSDYASVGKYTPYTAAPFSMNKRPRVKLYEAWYRTPILKRRFANGDLRGVVYDSTNKEHQAMLKGEYSLYDKLEMQIRCAVFCDAGLLWEGESPYNHGRFPLQPIWCYRRKRDNAPYGMIRALRDPQDDLNKRASKALWILSSNRVVMDDDAVDDIEALREEVARADSIVSKKRGTELTIDRDVQVADAHLNMMDRNIQHIRNVGGVTGENLGRPTNATSGVAIQNRQEQGSVVTTEPFDNLRFSTQIIGEMELANIEQFYTEPKMVRLVGDRGHATFKEINQIQNDGSLLNDITKEQADFVVSEQDYRSTLRQAMFESMFNVLGQIGQTSPQAALNLLDLCVEMADLPNRDEWVTRLRKMNGQSDPDKEPTPEEIEAQKQQAELANVNQEIALETAKTQLAELISKKDNLDAQSLMKRVESIYAAIQAAAALATNPGAASIADRIMKDSGFHSQAVQEDANLIQQASQNIGVQPPPIEMPTGLRGVQQGIHTVANDGAQVQ